MDDHADITLTHPYARDPAVNAGANPSTGSSGFAPVGADPTMGLARGLFMAPRTTSAATGGTPAPVLKPRVPSSKLPNAAVAKKGKVSAKKNKTADGSSRRTKKKLAGHTKDAVATKAPASSLAASTGDAHNMFDEMTLRYCQKWAAALKTVDTLNPSGTNDRDRLTIAQNLFRGEEKKTKKGNMKKGRPFTLPHCYEVLKDDEKWKPREDVNEETNKHKRNIDLDDDEAKASSDEGKRLL
ncbi:Tyrosine N-monooxygenase [Hordeum vulgare]|nr:Tyrosine N-monooxygenase [Hordeum vulgare]